MEGLIKLVAAVLSAMYKGVVLSFLWLWFVVPLGVPGIGMVQGIGISWVVALLTFELNTDPEKANVWLALIKSVIFTSMAWLAGFIWSFFL